MPDYDPNMMPTGSDDDEPVGADVVDDGRPRKAKKKSRPAPKPHAVEDSTGKRTPKE